MANVLANMQYVQRQGEIGRQQGQNRLLQGLAPQVVAGDPQAYDRAAAVDPQAAQQLQQAGDVKWARLKGAVDYMKQAQASGNPQGVEAAWQQVRPYFAKISGAEPPATFAEAAPHFGQLEARIAMATAGQPAAASGVQSTFVDEAGNRVAIMRDGSTQVLGRNNASIRVLEQEGQLPYGVVTSGGAAGQVVPLGQGMGAQAPQPQGWQQTGPTMFTAADGQPIPQEDQQALMAAVRQAEATGGEVNVPASTPAQGPLPPRLDYQNGGTVGPVRVPTSAEKAAAEAAARRGVELSTLPAELQMRTNAAIAQTTGQEAAKTQAEREAGEPARQEKVRQALRKSENVVQTIDDAISRVGPTTSGFLGSMLDSVPGTAANDLRVTANMIKANLAFDALQAMREASPTGGALGAVSERELALLESAVASIDQSQTPEQLRDALTKVKQHYTNWAQAVRDADEQARQRVGGNQFQNSAEIVDGPRPGAVQDGYRFRGGNPADPSSWERI